MKTGSWAATLLWASSVFAAPTSVEQRQYTNLDVTVLQFALTLEHLENAFYKGALSMFCEGDFEAAGYSKAYYNNLRYISFDEQSHVELLEGALKAAGVTPVPACNYSFPYTDVPSFITLSSVLEGVGTSAYLGGAPLITSKTYLTVAGSILVTEAIHTSYQRAAKAEVPMANPYGTPLDPTSVYTLAAMFIKSCPASFNGVLPFKPFPTLTYDAASTCLCEEPECAPSAQIKKRNNKNSGACAPPMANSTVMFTTTQVVPAASYLTFVSGLAVISVPTVVSGTTVTGMIPAGVSGQTYVFVTSTDAAKANGTLVDSSVLNGPAIVEVAPAPPMIDFSEI